MTKAHDHIIPLLSKRFQKKEPLSTTSRIMRHVVKETARMAANENKPKERGVVVDKTTPTDKSGMV
ncbi:MAG: hypothetical protein ACD_62C00439G0003 [uncultured bacterium]|nr:MAG: hypothetical protein ACD_62C00439G0003 [uncultured bacterium]HLD44812.1 hypothetical protein [bacterium]